LAVKSEFPANLTRTTTSGITRSTNGVGVSFARVDDVFSIITTSTCFTSVITVIDEPTDLALSTLNVIRSPASSCDAIIGTNTIVCAIFAFKEICGFVSRTGRYGFLTEGFTTCTGCTIGVGVSSALSGDEFAF